MTEEDYETEDEVSNQGFRTGDSDFDLPKSTTGVQRRLMTGARVASQVRRGNRSCAPKLRAASLEFWLKGRTEVTGVSRL